MYHQKIAIIGGGFAGVTLAAALVRAAVDVRQTNLNITIFEPNTIGPGLAYDLHAPNAFILNQELDFMGSLNVRIAATDPKDFYYWVQANLASLREDYKDYDFTNPKAYVPRSVFGRYVRARYQELRDYAADHGVQITEHHHRVDAVHRLPEGRQFAVGFGSSQEVFDAVVLTTGNYFNPADGGLKQTGKQFRPHDYAQYVSQDVPDGSVLLVAGTALYAYDAAIHALESGKYRKVIMASRRGMLRKVRGVTVPYTRQYVTIANLTAMAGGAGKPFRLAHLLQAIRSELQHAYGRDMQWKDGYSVAEILRMLQADISVVRADNTLPWRSIHSSITDDERHEFYARMAEEDKAEFVRTYSSLYQLFSAPMPITNAAKLQGYLQDGRLELVNGLQRVAYNQTRQGFEVHYAHQADSTPLPLGQMPATAGVTTLVHPAVADVYVDATGLGRAVHHLPLYRRLADAGLVAAHPMGGIRADMSSSMVRDESNEQVPGLYAIGHMVCGETVLPHNSLQISRRSNALGMQILQDLGVAVTGGDTTVVSGSVRR